MTAGSGPTFIANARRETKVSHKNKSDMKILFKLVLLMLALAASVYFILNWQQESTPLTDEIRQNAPGQFVQLEHGWVHYQLSGPDTSTLMVLIHGGGITGMEVWQKNMDYFLHLGYRVLAFDLYGRGYSSRPDVAHTPCVFHDQMVELLAKLEIDEPFHLVALSMGAMVALDFQKSHDHQIQKMVLIDPAASGAYQASPLLQVPVLSDFFMTVYWYPRAVEKQRKEFVDQEQFEVYAERLRHFMAFEGYKQTNYSTWMHMLNQSKMELVASLSPASLLVIVGAEDPFFRQNQLELYRTSLEGVNIVQIPQTGHMPQYERPEEVNQLIANFIQK